MDAEVKGFLKIASAAECLNVHPETVRRLTRRGVLVCYRDYLGHRLFRQEDLESYKAKKERFHADERPIKKAASG